MGIRVLIVEDHTAVREGLRFFLEKQSDMEVVGEAGNGRTALQLAERLRPDVVLMDLTMHEMNGIEATRRIVSESPSCKVLIFSAHSDTRLLLEALKAGAKGFILKSCSPINEIARAIQTVAAGESYLSPPITESLIKDYIALNGERLPVGVSLISAREREILQLVAEGKNTKEIAFTLDVSPKTIETHRQNIMKKLNIGSIAELTKFAIRERLTSLE